MPENNSVMAGGPTEVMGETQNLEPAESTRTARFAKFLRAAVAIKSRPVPDVHRYPTTLWFSGLPVGLDEIRSPLLTPTWPADDLRWLTVARVIEPDRPEAPEVCTPWLKDVPLDVPGSPPSLAAYVEQRDPEGMSLRLLKFSGGSVDDYAICLSS